MTFHVLGGGSIGLLYASSMRLAKSKLPVCLLLKSRHDNKVNFYNNNHALDSADSGLSAKQSEGKEFKMFAFVQLEDIHGSKHVQDIPCEIIDNSNDSEPQDIKNIILTTKAPDAVRAIESVYKRFNSQVNLVVMTNGSLGVVDEIKRSLKENGMEGKVNIIFASSTHGAMRVNDMKFEGSRHGDALAFKVKHTGRGQTFLEDNANSNHSDSIQSILKNAWEAAGLNVSTMSSERMYIMNWKKLAANCAINPLTALRNCTNGKLLSSRIERPRYEDTIGNVTIDYQHPLFLYKIIREVSGVALAEIEANNCMSDEARKSLSYTALADFVENVIRQTSRNKSSMLQDVIANRYPTEIMYLNGYVSRIGREIHGLDVQTNDSVTKMVENLTHPKLHSEEL
jgi:2-dehydropantoate 2-reductase